MARDGGCDEPTTDERRVIERSLARVRHETGLSLTFWGTVGPANDHLQLDAFAGEVIGALRGVSVGFGTGIGGKAAAHRRPLAVADYVGAERISHHYDHVIRAERLRSVLAIPIVVGRRLRAVMYGATRESVALGERALRLAADGARDLEQQLAVHEALREQRGHAETAGRLPVAERSGAEREAVRAAFARLRVLAAACPDTELRAQLTEVADDLTQPSSPPQPVRLTVRELDVLACISQGMTNADTAQALGVSAETVKSYLRSAMRRLGAASRWEAVIAARRLGQLP